MRNPVTNQGNRKCEQKRSTSRASPNAADELKRARDRTLATMSSAGGQADTEDLENSLFKGAAELSKSKGYSAICNPVKGLDMAISHTIEISSHWYVAEVILFKFQHGDGLIKITEDKKGAMQSVEGMNGRVEASCRELSEITRITYSNLQRGMKAASGDHGHLPIPLLVEDLEIFTVNLLLRKVNYYRFKGKNIEFRLIPVLLTSSRLQKGQGDDKPWIPIRSKLGEYDVDVVNVTNLASYLDFRDKEVRAFGRDALCPVESRVFSSALRLFRLLTLVAALTLLGAFLAYSVYPGQGLPIVCLSFLLVTLIELFGGWRLISGHRKSSREFTVVDSDPLRISPEHVVAHESEFSPNELSYLYSRYGGADLSRIERELKGQRISELTQKAKQALGKTRKLEAEELYSEAVMSLDRAARSALTATLLSVGVETRGRDVIEWVSALRRLLPNISFEDMTYLGTLRDQVNKGHDATKNEARRAKQVAETVIDGALRYLRNLPKHADALPSLPASATIAYGVYSNASVQITQYYQRIERSLSRAYSARSIGETDKFLYNLEQALAAAIRMKILEQTGENPSAMTLGSLLEELVGLNFKINEKDAHRWSAQLEKGEIGPDEAEEFERFCIQSLEALNIIERPTHEEANKFKLRGLKPSAPLILSTTECKQNENTASTPAENSRAFGAADFALEISANTLDTVESMKFLLNVTEEKELLDLGTTGSFLVGAKKSLRNKNADVSKSRRTDVPSKKRTMGTVPGDKTDELTSNTQDTPDSASKIPEELDNITKSLSLASTDSKQTQSPTTSTDRMRSDDYIASTKLLPFENLGDFRKAISYCPIPIVASFLSEDEISEEVRNTMRNLATRYHTRAAFISISSRSEDIARECKIKSYPTILLFREGKSIGELRSLDAAQLEKDLLKTISTDSTAEDAESYKEKPQTATSEDGEQVGSKPTASIRELEVTD